MLSSISKHYPRHFLSTDASDGEYTSAEGDELSKGVSPEPAEATRLLLDALDEWFGEVGLYAGLVGLYAGEVGL